MKLHSTRSNQWLYVDWWLMNHCSWQCSYCHEQLRNSSIPLVGIRDCVRFLHSLDQYAQGQSRALDINFTGGEVTEWNEFPELIQRAADLGHRVRFRTNANTDQQTWQQLMRSVHSVTMDLHPEYTKISRFLLALDHAVEQGVTVSVTVNMLKHSWAELEVTCAVIQAKYPTVNINRRMLFEDPVRNTQPVDYDEEQREKIKNQRGDLILIDDQQQSQYTDYQTLVLENKNHFKQWQCCIGLEQIIIDAWGKVYRGHCRVGGKIGEITDSDIAWPTEPVICKSDVCRNAFDIQATKSQ